MDELLNKLAIAVEASLPVSFDARHYTDSNGKTWIETRMFNQYETRHACILYEADKPIQYYLNFLVPNS
jgi:hypothetical protein